MIVKQLSSLSEIDKDQWNSLTGFTYPFLRHEFLNALEQSGAVCAQTGWEPKHLLVYENNELIALMPLYLKHHSQGEYVFDHQWAQAYQQQGQDYYPKWLTAVPYSPCQGPRIIIQNPANPTEVLALLIAFIQEQSSIQGISSWHCLFPVNDQAELLSAAGLLIRSDVQFHWHNLGYRDFADYLERFSSAKRKQVKRERRRVDEQGIEFLHLPGREITESQWTAFYLFYQMTYIKRGMRPYLPLDFFLTIAATMPENLLLILAVKDQRYVGAALSLLGETTLYGRYWGCYEEFNSLHFEACYYQGINYCLLNKLSHFDSGAQGEHKIARGFEPVLTHSAHWLQNQEFAQAIKRFLDREQKHIEQYRDYAQTLLPFKQT